MYYKNLAGKVYQTKEAIVMETRHSIRHIQPKPTVDTAEFLETEYYNQVEILDHLAHLYKVFGHCDFG